jgi:hypothetical protein
VHCTAFSHIIFRISMDTHSVDLSTYDPEESVIFRDNMGNQLRALEWRTESDDLHHRSGLIMFQRDALEHVSPLEAEYIELVVRDLAGIGGRVLRWDAPLPELVR